MNGFSFPISWLAEAAICGSVVIVLLFLLRPLVRRWLGARVVHGLWLVVLVRLLIPWTPHTPMAVVLQAHARDQIAPASATIRAFVVDGHPELASTSPLPLRERISSSAMSIAESAALIWLIGAAGVFGLSLAGAWRAAPLVKRARELAPESAAMRTLASLAMPVRSLRILETDELKSPALCGFLRPVILLPPGWTDSLAPEELRCIVLHEIGHHRRGDVLWRWAFLLARAIHWFNPLVWLAEREMRADQEMACDEWVLAHGDGIDAQTYGSVLLRACRSLVPPRLASPGHATMAESSAGLAQRIRHLARTKPHGWRALAGAAALGGLLLAIGPATNGAQPSSPGAEDLPANPSTPPAATPPAAVSAAPPAEPSPAPAATPPPDAKAKVEHVLIESRFVELSAKLLKDLAQVLPGAASSSSSLHAELFLEEDQFQATIRSLNKTKGVDLLSAPRVTTKSGQRAVVEVIREFRYPTEFEPGNDGSGRAVPTAFETRNTGVTLEILPVITRGNRIDVNLAPSVVEFEGFVNYGAGRPARKSLQGDALTEMMKNPSTGHIINQPIFSTRKITTSASIKSGQTVLVGGLSRTDTQMVEDGSVKLAFRNLDVSRDISGGKGARAKKTHEEKLETYLLIFVTARILSPEEVLPDQKLPPQPAASPAPSLSPSPAKSDVPSAVPVPDKPGFVTSPHAPKSGYVDVRGFASGTELKCPYTGKPFLVP